MRQKRLLHQGSIEHQKVAAAVKPVIEALPARVALEPGTAEGIQATFGSAIVAPGRNKDGLGVVRRVFLPQPWPWRLLFVLNRPRWPDGDGAGAKRGRHCADAARGQPLGARVCRRGFFFLPCFRLR